MGKLRVFYLFKKKTKKQCRYPNNWGSNLWKTHCWSLHCYPFVINRKRIKLLKLCNTPFGNL